jgi:NADPH:quinone reductase-like Zn-dependent oxidoreductase
VQLARRYGAHVVATASPASADDVRRSGAHEVLDSDHFEKTLEPVDLVFDTVGGDLLARSATIVRPAGKIVSIAEESETGTYFVVEPNREQLVELGRLVDAGELRVEVDSVFPLEAAPAAFTRSIERGKRGKVVLRIPDSSADQDSPV